MNVWLIADSHFGHQLILDLGIRPRDYEKQMWDSMYNLVKEDDLLIHLGDVAFKPSTEVGQAFKMIKGNKVLVRGNHDGGFEKYFKMGFNAVVDEFRLDFKRRIIFSHEPVLDLGRSELNIHGHLHGNDHRLQGDLEWYTDRDKIKYIDLAPEVWGCRVISLDEVLKKCSLKT